MYTFIIEGWSDHDQIKIAFPTPDVSTIVTNGVKYNNRVRKLIDDAIAEGNKIFILSDPDESGDQLAEMILREYNFTRILIDPEQSRMLTHKRFKYGVEYCKASYLREVLGAYMNDSNTRYGGSREEFIIESTSS